MVTRSPEARASTSTARHPGAPLRPDGQTLSPRQDLEIFLLQEPGELPLLALDAVGVARAVGKEERSKVATGPVSRSRNCRVGALSPTRSSGYNPELVEHIEGGRVEGRSAQLQHRLALCLEHDRGDAAASERQGCSEPDGASAYDDNGITVARHASAAPVLRDQYRNSYVHACCRIHAALRPARTVMLRSG